MQLQRGGGFQRLGQPAREGAERVYVDERLGARAARPELSSQLALALAEGGLERLGAPLVQASNELRTALAHLTEVIKDGQWSQSALKDAMTSLSTQTMLLVGTMTTLGSNSTAGQLLGTSMLAAATGSGVVDSILRGNIVEGGVTGPFGHIQLLPKGTYPFLEPTRPQR